MTPGLGEVSFSRQLSLAEVRADRRSLVSNAVRGDWDRTNITPNYVRRPEAIGMLV